MISAPNQDNSSSMTLNLFRLFLLRNISVASQLFVIVIVTQWLAIKLPLFPLVTILVCLLFWNFVSWWRTQHYGLESEREFFLQLAIDTVAFAGVLFYAGGATNPFAWFFLLPLMVAATVLAKPYIWSLAALTISCYSLLMKFHIPLGGSNHMSHSSGFEQHILGMWIGFVLSSVMISYFVAGIAHSMRQRDQALAKAREHALRDERIVALGTLAAGAAHELGTPLATISIVAEDLEQASIDAGDKELKKKVEIIQDQIARCKKALSVISASAGEERAESGQLMCVEEYLHQIINKWQHEKPTIKLRYNLEGDDSSKLLAERALEQALINILNNAADASPNDVEFLANWDEKKLILEIKDRGPGFSEDDCAAAGKKMFSNKEHGLGLGLFLTHSVVGRLGGDVSLYNRQGGGVSTKITLPLVSAH